MSTIQIKAFIQLYLPIQVLAFRGKELIGKMIINDQTIEQVNIKSVERQILFLERGFVEKQNLSSTKLWLSVYRRELWTKTKKQ